VKLSSHGHLFPILRWCDAFPPVLQVFMERYLIKRRDCGTF